MPKTIINTRITINGTDYNTSEQTVVERSIGDYNGTSNFTATFRNDYGKYNTTFHLHDEVIIYANMNAPATTKIFTGIIEDIDFSGSEKKEKVVLSGRDYGSVLQDVTIQPLVFINRDCGEIAKTIIEMSVMGIVTTNNVNTNTGTVLSRISFNQKNVFDALQQLASLAGYYFFVDANKDVNFISKSSISSGLSFDSTNIISADFETNNTEIFNKVWVYGSNIYTGTNFTGGTGGGSVISLLYNPYNTQVYVGGVLQSPGGVINMDNPYLVSGLKYVVDFNKKQIVFVSGTSAGNNVPASGTSNISIDYDRSTKIAKLVQDNASIGSYGPKSKVITDNNIKDYQAAVDAANSFLASNKNPKTQGTIDIKGIIDVTPGQTCFVNFPFHNIISQTYTILSAKYTFTPENNFAGEVLTLVLNKKYVDFVDTLKDQILRTKNIETGTLEGLYPYLQVNTGSWVMAVKNWSVATRAIGSSFILGHPVNGLLGSYTNHNLGWNGQTQYYKTQSGGTW